MLKNKYTINYLIYIIATILFFLLINSLIITSKYLTIKKISFINLKHVKKNEIELLTKPLIGKALYKTKISDIKNIINTHPLISKIFVKYIFPNELQLDIKERKIIAFIDLDKIYAIDFDGTIYIPYNQAKILKYPIIIINTNEKKSKIIIKKIKKALKILKRYEKLKIPAGQIYKVDVDSRNEVKIYFANQHEIILGNEPFLKK